MKVCHWTLNNGSGLNRVATNMALAERQLGIDSVLTYSDVPAGGITPPAGLSVLAMKDALEADIHVVHSHIDDGAKGKKVFVAHGTPEHCFQQAIEQGKISGYAAGDPFMLSLYRIAHTDITITFWPRHEYIWKSMNPKADIRTIPLGIDTEFWKPVESKGKWLGKPSFLNCENAHLIKWPLDLVLAFPLIMGAYPESILHAHYIPYDQHRWWYPLLVASGVSYKSFSSSGYMAPEDLRNAFCSTDYYVSPVRYGDFNNLSMEAAASGGKVISYKGNPYAHYWIDEGSQIVMAEQIGEIIAGNTQPREALPVPRLEDMAKAMKGIYDELV